MTLRPIAPNRPFPVLSRAAVAAVLVLLPASAAAADQWTEIRTPNVTVLANGSTGSARTLAWQIEQFRGAIVKIVPWVQVELDRPLLVLAVDSEPKMRQVVPGYYERGRDIRPASVWVSGIDRHYLAIRSDLTADDDGQNNPHQSAYFIYVSLLMNQSLPADMPLWFRRGLAGVLSNTIVRDTYAMVGAPIPGNLRYLRERTRLRLPALVAMPGGAPELKQGDGLERFDAQSWAFVHFLLFGNNGARAGKIGEFFRQVNAGTEPAVAMAETLGKAEQLEDDFVRYVGNSIFSFAKIAVDVSMKRDGFSQRQLAAAESSSTLALFHTSMGRPVEARAAIAAARAADASAPDSFVAEAIALEREGRRDEARAALARAVTGGSTSAYAHYTLARFNVAQKPDEAAMKEQEALLARAVELNPRHAYAIALLAEIRGTADAAAGLKLLERAVALDPTDPNHRLSAARILWRAGQHAQALRIVQTALALSTTDAERTRARELQQAIERDKGGR